MAEKRNAEDVSRAADRLVEAVEDLARQIKRSQPPDGAFGEPLSEEEADKFGNESVHETRREDFGAHGHLRDPLTDEEIREWERSREDRREREGYKPL